jgi:hypothetical protein
MKIENKKYIPFIILYLCVFFFGVAKFSKLETPVQAQVVELACGAGTRSVDALSTRNPNTGNIRQYACVDNNGNLTLNGGIAGGVAGSTSQVQFNSAGVMAANSNFTYDGGGKVSICTVNGGGCSNTGPGLVIGFGNAGGESIAFGTTGPVITDVAGTGINISTGTFSVAGSLACTANGTNCPSGTAAAVANLTGLAANTGPTTLLTPGANGFYRVSGWIVTTQAATTSSTLPNIQINFTDPDSAQTHSVPLTLINSTNTLGNFGVSASGELSNWPFYASSGVAITYQTTGYVSSGATPLQYALHIRLEGPF